MIKNDYKIFFDYVILYITRRNGDVFETFVDLNDLKFIDKLNHKVHMRFSKGKRTFYAEITIYLGMKNEKPKYRMILLHRALLGIEDLEIEIDHKNFNTLDNRRKNLRIATGIKNSQCRKSRNKNNKTGYRNVCLVGNKLYVQLQINGKNTLLKTFPVDKLEEAGIFAEKMRQKYYGEFAGKN